MEVSVEFVVASLVLSCFASTSYSHDVAFSSLQRTLTVSASSTPGQVLEAGEHVTVTWGYNQSLPAGADSTYSTLKLKLCYAPQSQNNRPDRQTDDNLDKDKTCPFQIVDVPYTPSINNTFTWTVTRDTLSATYFFRAYALNSEDHEVAYGQTTDALKATNLFEVAKPQLSAAAAAAYSRLQAYFYACLLLLSFFM